MIPYINTNVDGLRRVYTNYIPLYVSGPGVARLKSAVIVYYNYAVYNW